MNTLEKILKHNELFVTNKHYTRLNTDKNNPKEKIVLVSCMETRLIELLPQAMDIKNGDAKLIKVAGALIENPFGSVMKSILVAIHALYGNEVFIVGHDDCGMATIESEQLVVSMEKNGINPDMFATLTHLGIDIHAWINGFGSVEKSVENSVKIVRNHPLIPKDVPVSGLVINPETGQLRTIINGYENLPH